MNKNLKKVISAVAALSMSASSIAVLADFPDVEATASYKQAVNELAALNIISGYEDGTFRPDNLVTRAEITKMIVDALGEGSQAASGSGIDTKFTDVTGAHWAAGYVATGVADGFIAGMGDGTFAPDANVTFVQAQKMLVAAVGYNTYAQGAGGWPSGYKTWASSLGVTDGVSANDSDQLTRAQVAQMINNAMDAPVCVIAKYEPDVWGNPQPVLDIMDGKADDYQTLFTKKHDTYKVYGRVTATATAGGTDVDKVEFTIEKANNWDDEYYINSTTDYPAQVIDAYIGDSNADDYIRTYAEALIQKNDDDEYTIISITPAAANKSVELSAEDIDDSKTSIGDGVMYFYPAGSSRGSQKYKLDEDGADLFINGVDMGRTMTEADYQTYIVGNPSNTVVLQKETEQGSTISGDYNVIMITTYATAVVEEVLERSTYTSINFKDQSDDAASNIRVELDNEDMKYSFVLDGAEIAATDLQENDVLSIAYNVEDGFSDSNFYDVKVSRNVVSEAKCTGINSEGDEFTIGGEKYSVASGMDHLDPETTVTYTLYLDVFGNIAALEESATSTKLGILADVYKKANGDYVAEVITKEGVLEEYTVDDEDGATYEALVKDGDEKDNYPKQVIDYKVSSSGKLTIKDDKVVDAKEAGTADAVGEYKAASEKIGSIRISDSTVIIDISEIEKDVYNVVSVDSLVDGVEYTAYGYDKSPTDSSYRFVIITEGAGGFSSATQLAVFVESEMVTVDEDDLYAMTVVENGEEKQVIIDDDSSIDVDEFKQGDVFIYTTSPTTGYMNEAIMVFSDAAVGSLDGADDYADWRDTFGFTDVLSTYDFAGELSDTEEDVDILYGVAVNKKNNTFVLANEVLTSADGVDYVMYEEDGVNSQEITVSDNAKIYTYNFDISKKKGSRVSLDEGLMVTAKSSAAFLDEDDTMYSLDDTNVEDGIVFTIVRTFDGDEAQEIYQIVAEN